MRQRWRAVNTHLQENVRHARNAWIPSGFRTSFFLRGPQLRNARPPRERRPGATFRCCRRVQLTRRCTIGGVPLHHRWGAVAPSVGCRCTIGGVPLHHRWGAVAPSAGCRCTIGGVPLHHRRGAVAPSAGCCCYPSAEVLLPECGGFATRVRRFCYPSAELSPMIPRGYAPHDGGGISGASAAWLTTATARQRAPRRRARRR